ncbi:isocitrate lyase/phosphoenolpyruvate mutase family protein [Epibacterium ulvae]|uniref:isocitrate lyase/PEP mutase family protein n=1 Tax=Epibacterium ulvae TaxID=1156985 RepID=UPI001BFC9472|nr:isocitrate lyase/phosphoenolpyruvate mutase family protein [Epibacterium ulvae]MBT8152924.1 isocitrate lyase/phosphoenolpyruvate mutase family protein [Epibacterium ulvae]
MMDQLKKFQSFQDLHVPGHPFVVANAWDAGSARILAHAGFSALATTSAGYAFSKGRQDSSAALSREEILANAGEIVAATDLPVSGDLEDGFGATPDACAATIHAACKVGLVGGSIEDATGNTDAPLYAIDQAVDRVAAAVEAARDHSFLLTARAENFLCGNSDLKDTISRLQRFSEVGADVLFAPGLTDLNDIRTLCAEVDRPVNVVMGLSGPAHHVADLAEVGVARVSVGGSFARAALGALMRAADEVLQQGTFSYACDAVADADVRLLMRPGQR